LTTIAPIDQPDAREGDAVLAAETLDNTRQDCLNRTFSGTGEGDVLQSLKVHGHLDG